MKKLCYPLIVAMSCVPGVMIAASAARQAGRSPDIAGNYDLTGTNPDGAAYKGALAVI